VEEKISGKKCYSDEEGGTPDSSDSDRYKKINNLKTKINTKY
jgi:hypothetical protein